MIKKNVLILTDFPNYSSGFFGFGFFGFGVIFFFFGAGAAFGFFGFGVIIFTFFGFVGSGTSSEVLGS